MATAHLGTLARHLQDLAAGRRVQQWTDRQLLDDFTARQDEAAFAALVSRHGPMVLRVCRRVLHHEHDAEDAFQATFLVLAGHAGSIRKRDTVGDWLHGVAYRTAMKARRSAARRRSHEARRPAAPRPAAGPTWDDVQAVLDEEVQRLPQCYRQAFVLCALEGKGGAEAAAELGCKEGTVKSRVSRARRLLQGQLARRGIKLTALLAALAVAERGGRASVPAPLAQAAVRSGLQVAAGVPAAEAIPSQVAALAAGVTRAMVLTKAKIVTAVLLAVGLAAGAGALALAARERPVGTEQGEVSGQKPGPAAAKEATKPRTADDKDAVAYGGRVLGPDGRPVPGAKLYLTPAGGFPRLPFSSPESATTGHDGRFEFTIPKAKSGERDVVVAATAANHGVGWVEVQAGGKRDDLTVQLAEDDVPVTGQVVSLEGKPVPGATLRVLEIKAAPREDLGPWLEAARAKKGLSRQLEDQYLTRNTIALSPKVTTDAEGRFRLTGIGRNRLVRAQLDGPGIVSQYLHILTRPGKTIDVTEHEGQPEYGDQPTVSTYYGAGFRHVAAPARLIVGVVRDKDSKKPMAGVTIQSDKLANSPWSGVDIVRTTTDAQGRYRLTGMPKGEGNRIMVVPPHDQPYPVWVEDVPDGPGLGPVKLDFELKRGVWIEGRITDKATGKPLPAGPVEYFALDTNPNLPDYPGFGASLPRMGALVEDDGSYRVVGLPGPGLVAVWNRGGYLLAPARDDEYGVKESSLDTAPYAISFTNNYSAIARVDPARGAETVKRDVTLDPGWTFTGTLLGTDGQPLTGVRSFGTGMGRPEDRERTKTAEFTVRAFNPRRPRDVFFQHLEKGLVGVAQPPRENGGSIAVRMQPGAAVAGRLVDAEGKPRAGVELEVRFRPKGGPRWQRYSPERLKTDGEGRFHVGALLPGYEFRLSDGRGELVVGDALRSGETKNLGDVQIKGEEQ